MNKTRRLALMMAGSLLLISSCSNGSDAGKDPKPAAKTTTTQAAAVPPESKPPGFRPGVGEIDTKTVDLPEDCAKAVAPMRALMGKYVSGLDVTGDDNDIINKSLSDGAAACDAADWQTFIDDEFTGWMNAVPEGGLVEGADTGADAGLEAGD